MEIGQAAALPGELIQVGRTDPCVPVEADFAIPLVICYNQDNIRFFGRVGLLARSQGKNQRDT
jgi:hypothetical protein